MDIIYLIPYLVHGRTGVLIFRILTADPEVQDSILGAARFSE
jgi:hypothetical protein